MHIRAALDEYATNPVSHRGVTTAMDLLIYVTR